jgi:ABC-type Fe3+ transport system substrate-binding protein
MRRYLFIILFLVVLIAPFVLRLTFGVAREKSDTAASASRLVIVTPHNQDIRREYARAFDEWHRAKYGTGVTIDYRTPGGTNDIKRLLETTYRGFRDTETGKLPADVPADIDIVWGGGDYFFDVELNNQLGILQPLTIDPKLLAEVFPEPTLAGVKLYDVRKDKETGQPLPPRWVGVCLSAFGIVYNPDVYDALGLPEPQRWQDLTHEKLAGMIALADPTHSGSAAVAYMMVIQRAMADAEEAFKKSGGTISKDDSKYQQAIADGWKRGFSQLTLIAANARYFTDSASQVPNDVGNGEAAAGVAIDFYGRVYQETVGPRRCKFVAPVAATAITPDPVAVLYGVKGERRELANRFIEFLLTPEAQKLWILKPGTEGGPRLRSLRRPPVRRDVYADRSQWADDVNPFADAGGFNQRVEWMELFGDTRPLWAAAWIDSREILKDAYATVRSVPDDARRAELIAELADLPITMADVAKLRKDRKEEEKTGNVEEWKAKKRIEWANKFRDHYAKVAAKASAKASAGAS